MKKFVLAILIVLSMSSAFAFPVQVQSQIRPTVTQFVIWNNWMMPIVCNGNAMGITMMRYNIYSSMMNVVIYPGQFATSYVYTSVYDPFIGAQAFADCRWF